MGISGILKNHFPLGSTEYPSQVSVEDLLDFDVVSTEFFGDLAKSLQRGKVKRLTVPKIDAVISVVNKQKRELEGRLQRGTLVADDNIPSVGKALLEPLVSNGKLEKDLTAGVKREIATMTKLLVDYQKVADAYLDRVVKQAENVRRGSKHESSAYETILDEFKPPLMSIHSSTFNADALIQNKFVQAFSDGGSHSAYVQAETDTERRDAMSTRPPELVFKSHTQKTTEGGDYTVKDIANLLECLGSYVRLLENTKRTLPDYQKYSRLAGGFEDKLPSEHPDRDWFYIGELLDIQAFAVESHAHACLKHIGRSIAGILKLCHHVLK